MDHAIWVFVHVMLLVYWLGADLGVLLLAKAAKRPELSFAERAFASQMAIRIDLVPRLCFTVMLPVGLLVTLGRHEGKPLAARLNHWHLGLQALLLVIVGAIGISSWLGHGPLPGGWFAAKIVLFALIFAMGIGIDFAFRPIGPAFARLATEGSKPDIENTIGIAVDGAIRYVLGLYALLIAIAFLGVTKFL